MSATYHVTEDSVLQLLSQLQLSMVSNILLKTVSVRLNELYADLTCQFGNICVLFMGDLLQLTPVQSEFCFEPLWKCKYSHGFNKLSARLMEVCYSTSSACHLWIIIMQNK